MPTDDCGKPDEMRIYHVGKKERLYTIWQPYNTQFSLETSVDTKTSE